MACVFDMTRWLNEKEQRVMSHTVWTSCLQEYMLQRVAVCSSELQCATECVRQMYPITNMHELCHTCKLICTPHTCRWICTCDKRICTCDLYVWSDSTNGIAQCIFTINLHSKFARVTWPMHVCVCVCVCVCVWLLHVYGLHSHSIPHSIYCLSHTTPSR